MNPYMELPRLGLRHTPPPMQPSQSRPPSSDHLWLSAGIYRAVSAVEKMIEPLVDRVARSGRPVDRVGRDV